MNFARYFSSDTAQQPRSERYEHLIEEIDEGIVRSVQSNTPFSIHPYVGTRNTLHEVTTFEEYATRAEPLTKRLLSLHYIKEMHTRFFLGQAASYSAAMWGAIGSLALHNNPLTGFVIGASAGATTELVTRRRAKRWARSAVPEYQATDKKLLRESQKTLQALLS